MVKKLAALLLVGCFGISAAADRYEAETAIPADDHSATIVTSATASGGSFVEMREGSLVFTVTTATAGYYTLWLDYAQPNDANGKIQNLVVNGSAAGQISFPYSTSFVYMKGSAKIKLAAGANTVSITKSWGWVNIDYIELTPFVATPFAITGALSNPNATDNTKKMFGFLMENFGKKVISGVMTNTVMQNDGKYTPNTMDNQTEIAWINSASGKMPALIGLDFMHDAGLNSDQQWHQGYTAATLGLAENVYNKGGIPAYCWHWKDPDHLVETFYTLSSGNTPYTTFNLNNAFLDSTTHAAFNTSSTEYTEIIRDLDLIAAQLKILADKGIPVLWRPLHEASGKWFWWGSKGGAATQALYRLMYDRFTNLHGLNNLIWVWTTDEAGDALDWYPGDAYVDVVGRDFYYYPRVANHASLVASFEKVKEIFGGRKLITLSENGSVPHPDSLVADGAGWSYFMPWYGDYTMDGWAHDNTAADWNSIMNNNYVITIDKMPGWANYVPPSGLLHINNAKGSSLLFNQGTLELTQESAGNTRLEVFGLQGNIVATLHQGYLGAGTFRFSLQDEKAGMYMVRVQSSAGMIARQIAVH